jgi:hypothetical protein
LLILFCAVTDGEAMYEYCDTLTQQGQIECMLHFKTGELDTIWTGDNDGFVHVFNIRSKSLVHRFCAHNSGVLCMVLTSKNQVKKKKKKKKKICFGIVHDLLVFRFGRVLAMAASRCGVGTTRAVKLCR